MPTCSCRRKWIRVRFAYLELTQAQIDNAENERGGEKERARSGGTGFSPIRAGCRFRCLEPVSFNLKETWGAVVGQLELRRRSTPRKLLGGTRIEPRWGATGYSAFWKNCSSGHRKRFWAAGDRLRMVRLLGRNPVDVVIGTGESPEIFAASHAFGRRANRLTRLLSDMSEPS